MCTHTIIDALSTLQAEDLERVSTAVEAMRRASSADQGSTVLEPRSYRNGLLQFEERTFHFREGGKLRTLYIGKT